MNGEGIQEVQCFGTKKLIVCKSCGTTSCWNGNIICENWRDAGSTEKLCPGCSDCIAPTGKDVQAAYKGPQDSVDILSALLRDAQIIDISIGVHRPDLRGNEAVQNLIRIAFDLGQKYAIENGCKDCSPCHHQKRT